MRRPEFIARQSRCPSGLLGRVIGHIMSVETAAANESALKLLDLDAGDRVLEVGFGHGRTIERAAAMVGDGLVAGIDASEDMVRMATRRCRRLIESGRVRRRSAISSGLSPQFRCKAKGIIGQWDVPVRGGVHECVQTGNPTRLIRP